MLVVLHAVNFVIHEKEKGVPCTGCFSCAFAFGSYLHVWSLYKNLKNLKKTLQLLNIGFSSPDSDSMIRRGSFCDRSFT